MIKVKVWDTNINKWVNKSQSIIQDVTIKYIESGYMVLINLKTRAFDLNGNGSCSDGTKSIYFIDDNKLEHEVEYKMPKSFINSNYVRLIEREKDQVIIYYIENIYLFHELKSFDEYVCPSILMMETLDKLKLNY